MLERSETIVKAALVFFLGCFGLLTGVDNILDYAANYHFVKHVLSMDALQPWFKPSPAILQRAIHSTAIYHWAYGIIISIEILFGVLCLFASVCLVSKKTERKQLGKRTFLLAGLLGLGLWFFGFCVIASEYFSMWGSRYNAQATAFMFSLFILLSMRFVLD